MYPGVGLPTFQSFVNCFELHWSRPTNVTKHVDLISCQFTTSWALLGLRLSSAKKHNNCINLFLWEQQGPILSFGPEGIPPATPHNCTKCVNRRSFIEVLLKTLHMIIRLPIRLGTITTTHHSYQHHQLSPSLPGVGIRNNTIGNRY